MTDKQYYYVVYYSVRKPFDSEEDHLRWAIGNVGESFPLGVYTSKSEAEFVCKLLRFTTPAKNKQVRIKLVKEREASLRQELRIHGCIDAHFEMNVFYPESLINGYSKVLPPVTSEELAAFLKLDE